MKDERYIEGETKHDEKTLDSNISHTGTCTIRKLSKHKQLELCSKGLRLRFLGEKKMNTTLFKNDMFGEVRNIMDGATPWFVANDIAKALGYERPADTVRKVVWKENKGVAKLETPSGTQDMVIINEAGVYQLIFRSKLESAKQFQRWVFEEVLPSIRKNGFYVSDNLSPNQVARLQYTVREQQKKLHKTQRMLETIEKQNDKLIEALAEASSTRKTYRSWYYGK